MPLRTCCRPKRRKICGLDTKAQSLPYWLIREARVISNNLSLPRILNGNPWRNSCANGVIYFALARSL
jgi:hypothetical protein